MKKLFLMSPLIFACSYANTSFEYGLGLSHVSAPLYIGSKEQQNYVIPMPYISFKSKYLNIKRSKVSTDIYSLGNNKLELSFSGQPPADSKDSARTGMHDLDLVLEIGPKYTYRIFDEKYGKLNLEIPIRLGFSVGEELFKYQGFISSLNFRYTKEIFYDFIFTYTTGVTYNSEKINNYYYDVDKKYETINRKEYKSDAGYAGFHNSIAFTKRWKDYWFGSFFRYYDLNNVSYEKSPLFEKKNAFYSAVAFAYIF